jgi:DNA topoisomerase VI subunit B
MIERVRLKSPIAARVSPRRHEQVEPQIKRKLLRAKANDAVFDQGQNRPDDSRFLPIVATSKVAKPQLKITRVAFRMSRLAEFCTLRELQNQTGHSAFEWLTVLFKELMDNALDACEEAEVAPVISISVTGGTIVITDNASGIPAATIKSILDYSVRVSSREAYVSPTRGAQGNALKTVLAMAYVLDRECDAKDDAIGETIIESQGVRHHIRFDVDHVNLEPRLAHTTSRSATAGTRITIKWTKNRAFALDPVDSHDTLIKLVENFTWLNPHLTLRLYWFGKRIINVVATNPNWQKWNPRDPTSAQYSEARLERYMAAHVARDRDLGRDRPVREFIAEFRGLSGSVKQRQVLAEVGCSHVSLSKFFGVNKVNSRGIARLLSAMQKHSRPVPPKLLGVIGKEHLQQRFLAAGGNAKTFKYQLRIGTNEYGIPYLIETAFGLHETGLTRIQQQEERRFITGVNWSVGISNPFRAFGRTGEGLESTLYAARANATQPVIVVVHLACAYVQYADRGKSSIILSNDAVQNDA